MQESGTSLSGGQQQRLCIARAIAVDPSVILMDEPCSSLDPVATAVIEELIDELKKKRTIIIVTHNMQQAARVSEKTAFFHLGKLIEFSDTEAIFTKPKQKQTSIYGETKSIHVTDPAKRWRQVLARAWARLWELLCWQPS